MDIRDSANPFWAHEYVHDLLDELNQAVPAPQTLNGGTCKLFKTGFHPTPANVLADYAAQEADFTDYAGKSNSLVGPASMGPNCQGLEVSLNWLITTDPVVVANTVGGWYYVNAAQTKVIAACEWAAPVSMAAPGDKLVAIIRFPLSEYQPPNETTV